MTWRATIISWIAAIALGVAAWIAWDRSPASGSAANPAGEVHRSPIPVDDVDRVVVRRHGALDEGPPVDLVFERDAEGWRQVEPFEVAADGYQVRQLVVAAADLVASRRTPIAELSEAGGLGRIGLDDSIDRVVLDWPGGSTTLELGSRTVAGRAWLRVDGGDDVLVVDDALHDRAIDDDVRNWRSRRLFPDEAEIVEVVVVNGATTTRLERAGRRWSMTSPVATRADAAAVDGLLAVLGRVEHDGFVADVVEEPGRFGLDEPTVTIEVVRDDGERERLLIGGPAGIVGTSRFAMLEGVPMVIQLAEPTLVSLLPGVGSLVEATGTGERLADVRFLVIDSDLGSVRLERDLDRWSVAIDDGPPRSVDPELVAGLFETLSETRASDLQVQSFPLDLEVATVVLHGFDGRPIDAVRIAREPDRGRWALENGDGVLRLLPARTEIPLAPSDWGG